LSRNQQVTSTIRTPFSALILEILTILVHVFELHPVQNEFTVYLLEISWMNNVSDKAKFRNSQRLEAISNGLREIRFSEGRNQDEYVDYDTSRRQIQRGEHSLNLTLTSLFNLLDCYGYTLQDFFEDME
jgi:hypothetical protein